MRAAASPPTRSPAQYSPALASGTTRFGMVRGGIDAALGHAHTAPSAALQQEVMEEANERRREHGTMDRPGSADQTDGVKTQYYKGLASAMRAAQLRSVTRRPPAASLPGHLPGALLPLWDGTAHLGAGFPLRCRQRLSLPDLATQRCRSADNWHTSGPSSPVLSY